MTVSKKVGVRYHILMSVLLHTVRYDRAAIAILKSYTAHVRPIESLGHADSANALSRALGDASVNILLAVHCITALASCSACIGNNFRSTLFYTW